MYVKLIRPKMRMRPMDTELKTRMSPHLGLMTVAGILRDSGMVSRIEIENENIRTVTLDDRPDLVEDTGLVSAFWPWLLFLWGTGIPCYMALFEFWHVCGEIKADNSFCEENAIRMMNIALLILGDVAYFFAGNVLFLMLGMNHPGIFLISLAVDVFGVGIGVAAAALSHLVYKAAVIQAENDLTV